MKSTSKTFARQPSEKYFTPISLTVDFLAVEGFPGRILDPCAGAGHIIDAAGQAGYGVQGFDIEPDREDIEQADFFDLVALSSSIVTNPPYGPQGTLAVRIIERALDVTLSRSGKVAMLLHKNFDSAKTRRHLFADHPAFAGEYVLLQRIYWANLEAKKRSSTNHAWFVWDWRRAPGDPYLRYLASSDGKDWR